MFSYRTSAGERTYKPSAEDRLWLLRAVTGEGDDYNEVAQALVNRFGYLSARSPKLYPTLSALVRAYSQPVNPKWNPGGSKYDASKDRSGAKAKRRARIQSLIKFSSEVTAAVDRALAGAQDIPSRAVHFSAPGSERPGMLAASPPVPGRNQLFSVPGSREWTGVRAAGGAVLDVYGPTMVKPDGPPKWLVAAAVAAAVYVMKEWAK